MRRVGYAVAALCRVRGRRFESRVVVVVQRALGERVAGMRSAVEVAFDAEALWSFEEDAFDRWEVEGVVVRCGQEASHGSA